jgi:hypothetical protein
MKLTVTVVALLGISCLVFGDNIVSRQKVEVTQTERADFPAGGLLRLEHSTGELTIEGWNRPDVEIITVQTTKADYLPQNREKAASELKQSPVSVEHQDQQLVVKTISSKLRGPLPSITLSCNIKAPINAKLDVEHGSGEVHIDDMRSSDIRVTVANGDITLHLPEDGKYHINAKSDIGGVQSDFSGEEKRRWWLIGHRYAQQPPDGHDLFLRVEVGDITILKIRTPREPAPLTH